MKAPEAARAAAALAAGVGVGLLAEHRLVRRPMRGDGSSAGAPLPRLSGVTSDTVASSDGVQLAVYETGPAEATTTVVFAHGYTCTADSWAAQVPAVVDFGCRAVLYDQRGHGASEAGPAAGNTIEQLGRDLSQILRHKVPHGQIVLAGHSMGGMTIMALAEQEPELFGSRVCAVALVDTSSAGMAQVTLGLPAALAWPVGKLLPHAGRAAPVNRRVERFRSADSDFGRALNARVAFAPGTSPAAHAAMARMQAPMTLETMAAFLPTFSTHDRTGALSALKSIPVVIVVGGRDVLTPPSHSRVMADALPSAVLVTIPRVGHMSMMEAPDAVNEQLLALLKQVT